MVKMGNDLANATREIGQKEAERFAENNPPDPNPPKNAAYWKRRATTAEARVAELEAENASLRQGVHPPARPLANGFNLGDFMAGCTPEDIAALCDALDRDPLDPS